MSLYDKIALGLLAAGIVAIVVLVSLLKFKCFNCGKLGIREYKNHLGHYLQCRHCGWRSEYYDANQKEEN